MEAEQEQIQLDQEQVLQVEVVVDLQVQAQQQEGVEQIQLEDLLQQQQELTEFLVKAQVVFHQLQVNLQNTAAEQEAEHRLDLLLLLVDLLYMAQVVVAQVVGQEQEQEIIRELTVEHGILFQQVVVAQVAQETLQDQMVLLVLDMVVAQVAEAAEVTEPHQLQVQMVAQVAHPEEAAEAAEQEEVRELAELVAQVEVVK